MSNERSFITKEKAMEYIGDSEYIHVFLNPNGMLIGADWTQKEISELLDRSKTIEIGGGQCVAMKHPVVAFDGKFHFISATIK